MTPLLLATAAEDLGHSHSVADALPHLGGMLLVIATLAVLWSICALNAKIVQLVRPSSAPTPAPAAAPAPIQPAATPAATEANPPELVAVIAAAVAAVAGPGRRIVSIRKESSGWAKAGRQSVLTSHRIR